MLCPHTPGLCTSDTATGTVFKKMLKVKEIEDGLSWGRQASSDWWELVGCRMKKLMVLE